MIASSNPPTSAKRAARTSVNAPGHREHVAQPVVLALVELARARRAAGPRRPCRRSGRTGRTAAGRPTATSLGPTTSASQRVGGGDQGADRARVGRGVVVAEHVELGPRHQVEHGVGRRAEAGVAVDRGGPAPRAAPRGPRSVGSSVAGVDHQDVEVGVVLGGQRRAAPGRSRSPGASWVTTTATTGRGGDGLAALRAPRRADGSPRPGPRPRTPRPCAGVGSSAHVRHRGISVDDVTDAVENTVYTAVGLGILGFQHLQVQRRELEQVLDAVASRQVVERTGPAAADRTAPCRPPCSGSPSTSPRSSTPLTGVGRVRPRAGRRAWPRRDDLALTGYAVTWRGRGRLRRGRRPPAWPSSTGRWPPGRSTSCGGAPTTR